MTLRERLRAAIDRADAWMDGLGEPKLIECPACSHEVSKGAKACPACGHPPPKGVSIGRLLAGVCGAAILLAGLTLPFFHFLYGHDEFDVITKEAWALEDTFVNLDDLAKKSGFELMINHAPLVRRMKEEGLWHSRAPGDSVPKTRIGKGIDQAMDLYRRAEEFFGRGNTRSGFRSLTSAEIEVEMAAAEGEDLEVGVRAARTAGRIAIYGSLLRRVQERIGEDRFRRWVRGASVREMLWAKAEEMAGRDLGLHMASDPGDAARRYLEELQRQRPQEITEILQTAISSAPDDESSQAEHDESASKSVRDRRKGSRSGANRRRGPRKSVRTKDDEVEDEPKTIPIEEPEPTGNEDPPKSKAEMWEEAFGGPDQ